MISGDGCAVPGARVCIGAQGSVPWRCFAQCYDLPTHRRPHTYSAHISRHDEGCFQPVWLLQAPSCDFCPSSRWPAIVLVAMSGKLALRLALRCFRRVVTLWRIAVYMFRYQSRAVLVRCLHSQKRNRLILFAGLGIIPGLLMCFHFRPLRIVRSWRSSTSRGALFFCLRSSNVSFELTSIPSVLLDSNFPTGQNTAPWSG